jgi:hypothetical protein
LRKIIEVSLKGKIEERKCGVDAPTMIDNSSDGFPAIAGYR